LKSPTMDLTSTAFCRRLRIAWEAIAEGRAEILCVALACNAFVAPYLGLHHDARLYAAQSMERAVPGTFAGDLFFLYGSQDRYSVFSLLMTPLVVSVGLDVGFFILYVVSKVCFFWAAQGLAVALLRDQTAAALAVLLLAILPMHFGGNGIFQVNEPFLTPRLIASALVLLGLERLVVGSTLAALLLHGLALFLHPLQAAGGLGIVMCGWLASRLTPRQVVLGFTFLTIAGVALIAAEPIAEGVFGVLDEEWHSFVLNACFFIRPSEWSVADWSRILVGCLILGAGTVAVMRERAYYLGSVELVALGGLAMTMIGVQKGYQLIIQGSPYRALWLLELHAIIVGSAWAVKLWKSGTSEGQASSALILLLVTSEWTNGLLFPVTLYLMLFLVCATVVRGLARVPRQSHWQWLSAGFSVVGVIGILGIYDCATLVTLFKVSPTLELDINPLQVLSMGGNVLFKAPILLALIFILAFVRKLVRTSLRFQLILILFWLVYPAVLARLRQSEWYESRFTAGYRHRHFVISYLSERAGQLGQTPTVYWPVDLRYIWFDSKCHSYFTWVQMSGCAFNRGTAIEGGRRARLVGRFELELLRKVPNIDQSWWRGFSRICRIRDPDHMAGRSELLALCSDGALDYVVLDDNVGDLYCATDGRFFIYDCRQLREAEAVSMRAACPTQ
jgi:hypothetical protein